jgi:hypothetical protein
LRFKSISSLPLHKIKPGFTSMFFFANFLPVPVVRLFLRIRQRIQANQYAKEPRTGSRVPIRGSPPFRRIM